MTCPPCRRRKSSQGPLPPTGVSRSGISEGNIGEFYNEADGFIIGSAFKLDGLWSNTIDPARVVSFMKAVHRLK